MRTRHLIVASVIVSLAIVEFGVFKGIALTNGQPPKSTGTVAGALAAYPSPTAPPPPFDVKPLLAPKNKYLGVALPGVPTDVANVSKYADLVGKQPNMLTIYASFDDGFAASQVREAYQQGALAIVRWEPFKPKLADIAAGKHDAYVTKFAKAVRTLNLPIVLTFSHEMNGNWYPWGHSKNDPADFVAAWRHVYDLFQQADATNVIWAWTPNVINPVPSVKLKPLYPGDKYVDWIGMDGYFTSRGAHTYSTLFGPTKRAIRKFTKKPFLVVETGAEPGASRPTWIRDMLRGVAADKEMLGLVYFNQNGSARWKIDSDQAAVTAFRSQADKPTFGFEVK